MNKLHSLIHSLSPSEKRYFKLYAQRQVQKKSTNYFKLFEAINEQDKYDEDDLLKKFRKETFVKQFGVTKNYLFQIILNAMREYNEENFIEWKIRNYYSQIKILASKGLDAEAEKLIQKTKALAWQYEYYYVIMDVLHIEKYLFGNFRIYEQSLKDFDPIAAEDIKAVDVSYTHTLLGHIWHYLTILEMEIGVLPPETIRKKADAYVSAKIMQEEPHTSYNSKFRFHATWSLYYNLINDQQKNYTHCKACILIREEQIEKQPLQNLDPLASYYNFLVACEKANRWDEFSYYLQKIWDFEAPTIEVNIRRMHNYCWCGLMYYLHQKNYTAAAEIVTIYQQFFLEKNIRFRKDFKIYIEACAGLVHLFRKEYKQALHMWNDILNGPSVEVELRTQGAVRLYLMMLHYEEGNTEIMDYLAAQAKKYLQQIAIWHEPEKYFVKSLNEIAHQPDKGTRKSKMQTLYQQLSEMPIHISGNAVNPFILNWIKAQAGLPD
ncbi:MAG: hypothetical protein J0L83_13080 [Chitinophagales bacterium]|nr:hypothetical protein [Chitinophagales bacterium]